MARRSALALILAMLAQAAVASGSGASRAKLVVDCSTAKQRIELPAEGSIAIVSQANQPAWLEAQELGFQLSATAPTGALAFSINVPYRRGFHYSQLQPAQQWLLERMPPVSTRPATALIRVTCDERAPAIAERDWLRDLAALTAQLTTRPSAADADALLGKISVLEATAANERQRALVLHARAQILLSVDRTADSAEAFALAERGWSAIGDDARARVARVGRVEDLMRLARHQEALSLTDAIPSEQARSDYFAARLHLSSCLAQRYLGRMTEALACFRSGVANLEHLDETLDLVSALQDMADVSRFLGDLDAADRLGKLALQKSSLPMLPMLAVVRGRIHLMLGNIAMERGDIAGALAGFDGALTEFAAARLPRWEANALLLTADLYLALGAHEEASEFVSAALARLSERDAPARVAAAAVVQARVDLQLGRVERARTGLATAIATYTRLSMPADLDAARISMARLLMHSADYDGAAELVAVRDQGQQLNHGGWRLIEAGLLAIDAQCTKALAILGEFDGKPTSIDSELQRVQVRAQCLAANGRRDEARKVLLQSAQRIAALAQQVDSPLLGQMLAAHIAPLRRSAFRLAGAAQADQLVEVANVWHWLQLDDAALARRPSHRAADSSRQFDAEIALELLPIRRPAGAVVDSRGPRHLLSMLASGEAFDRPRGQALTETTLAQLQQRLGDAVLVSYVDAGSQASLIWISRDRVRIQATAKIETLRAAADRLTVAASDRNTPLAKIDQAAAQLTQLLWPAPDDAGAAPSHLLVDATSPLASVPWSLLTWPKAQAGLLDSTRITIARIGSALPAQPLASPQVAVFVAGQENSTTFEPLWNARAEPGLIQSGIAAKNGKVSLLASSERASLMDAFSRAQPWLHVAAHGGTLPSRIGYAGIWLEASANDPAPRFVSWLEILARGAANELVVLNACQLAETPQAAVGVSFADAVSRAGARDVVAARWQVSDGATGIWVPAFYRAMSEGAGAADSLWQAQRRLQASRAFRHPFYWASYVHYGRI